MNTGAVVDVHGKEEGLCVVSADEAPPSGAPLGQGLQGLGRDLEERILRLGVLAALNFLAGGVD